MSNQVYVSYTVHGDHEESEAFAEFVKSRIDQRVDAILDGLTYEYADVEVTCEVEFLPNVTGVGAGLHVSADGPDSFEIESALDGALDRLWEEFCQQAPQ